MKRKSNKFITENAWQ